jgi:translation initiation factor 2 gamma subunit (eIF-2gamma)
MSQGHPNNKSDTDSLLEKIHGKPGGVNWLGHRHDSGAAKIDALLLVGATHQELSKCRDAVDEHLYHLQQVHGLNIETVQNRVQFKR